MLTTRKLLAVSTLGTTFFLLGTRSDAAVIGNLQESLTFNSYTTDTMFLTLGGTEKLVSAGTSSTLVGNFLATTTTALPITVAKAVPEPLTILSSGVALGFGALFKKEYSKKQKKVRSSKKQNV